MFQWNLDLIIREQKCIQSSLPKVQKLFLPITGYKNLHLSLKLAVALNSATLLQLCVLPVLLPGDQNWWNSKKHVNWQYEESVLSYCLTGICTWAAVDTSPDTANSEFQGFVPRFIHCNLSRRGLFSSPEMEISLLQESVFEGIG